MPYSWEAEALASTRPTPSPYMEWQPPRGAEPCDHCQPLLEAAVGRQIEQNERLAHLDDMQRRRIELLEREHAVMAARLATYEAREGRTTA